MKLPEKFTDLPTAYKEMLRGAFVGNETDTDEYRETQPEKGLEMISNLIATLGRVESRGNDLDVEVGPGFTFDGHENTGDTPSRRETLRRVLDLTRKWIDECGMGPYTGCDQLAPILAIYFDVLWEQNEHPYYGGEAAGVKEALDFLKDCSGGEPGELDENYDIIPGGEEEDGE